MNLLCKGEVDTKMTNHLHGITPCIAELNNQINAGWEMVALGAPEDVRSLCSNLGIDLANELSERALFGIRSRRDLYLDALYLLTDGCRASFITLDDASVVSILRQHAELLDIDVSHWAELDNAELAHIQDVGMTGVAKTVISSICYLNPGYSSSLCKFGDGYDLSLFIADNAQEWVGMKSRLCCTDLVDVAEISARLSEQEWECIWQDLIRWGAKPVVVRTASNGPVSVHRAQYGIAAHKLMAAMRSHERGGK